MAATGTVTYTEDNNTLRPSAETGAYFTVVINDTAYGLPGDPAANSGSTIEPATLERNALGAVDIVGTAAITAAGDTTVSAGAVDIVGAAAITEDDHTTVSAGAVDIVGTATITEDDHTLVSIAIEDIDLLRFAMQFKSCLTNKSTKSSIHTKLHTKATIK